MTKAELMQWVHDAGLSRVADDIERIIKPSIRITAHPTDESDLSPGTSKFGGLPDLPPDVEWPEQNGRPLNLIAQLNLREIALSTPLSEFAGQLSLLDVAVKPVELELLPPSGILYFFYDATEQPWGYKVEHRAGWQVMYSPMEAKLSRSPLPSAFTEDDALPACRLEFSREVNLPDPASTSIQFFI